ncbi:MAG: hypothetical protein Q4C67_03630 [Deinococcus sp.]|nr:hypothetical protein [Deinococcus sp.]
MTGTASLPARLQTHMGICYAGELLERSADLITVQLTLREFSCFPQPGDRLGVRLGQERLAATIVDIRHGVPEDEWDAAVQLRLICQVH